MRKAQAPLLQGLEEGREFGLAGMQEVSGSKYE